MENILFCRWTNPDYHDLLRREIIKTDFQIKKTEFKRIKARLRRIARAGIKIKKKIGK